MLAFLDAWGGLLPPALHSHILETLVFPKVHPALRLQNHVLEGRAGSVGLQSNPVLFLQSIAVGKTA